MSGKTEAATQLQKSCGSGCLQDKKNGENKNKKCNLKKNIALLLLKPKQTLSALFLKRNRTSCSHS